MANNPNQSSKFKGKAFYSKKEFKHRSNSQPKFEMSVAANSNDLMNEVASEMSCPVCKEHLQQPIFMCETGHNICGSCKKNLLLPVCPLCKSTVTGLRNFALEAISSKISIPCVNKCYGCDYKCLQNAMSDHLNECKFKPIDCPFKTYMKNCNWSGNKENLVTHFQIKHPQNMKLKIGDEVIFVNFSVNNSYDDLQLIPFDNNLFVYYVDINVEEKIGFWSIQMIGTTEDAQKWKYDFTFKNIEKSKYINFSERCESAEVPFVELCKRGICVGVPTAILKNFTLKNNEFRFKFFIRPASFITRNHHNKKHR